MRLLFICMLGMSFTGTQVANTVSVAYADDAQKTDSTDIQGVWSVSKFDAGPLKLDLEKRVAYIRGTKTDIPDKEAEFKIIFEDNEYTAKIGSVVITGEFTLNTSAKPKQIDIVVKSGPSKGKTIKGIYKFFDGELLLCHNNPDDKTPSPERPSEFSSPEDSNVTFTVLKRKKK